MQLAQGLSAAHDRGVIHRDLKPENLFVTDDGRLKILDFGIAKLTGEKAVTTAPVTQTGTIMGTVGYMSPEQVRGEHADHRSDLFSFGTILHEMLSGKLAFDRPTPVETGNAILNDEPPDLPESVPPELDKVVRRYLEKRPQERFQSAHDLAFQLATIPVVSTGPRPALAAVSRRRLWPFAVLALAAAAFTLGRPSSRPAELPLPKFTRLSTGEEFPRAARFAPDGAIFFTGGLSGVNELFSTTVDHPFSKRMGLKDVELASIASSGELAILLSKTWPPTLARMELGESLPGGRSTLSAPP